MGNNYSGDAAYSMESIQRKACPFFSMLFKYVARNTPTILAIDTLRRNKKKEKPNKNKTLTSRLAHEHDHQIWLANCNLSF